MLYESLLLRTLMVTMVLTGHSYGSMSTASEVALLVATMITGMVKILLKVG